MGEITRRELLARAARAGLAAPSIALLLAACETTRSNGSWSPLPGIPSPVEPYPLPTWDDSPAIASDLPPEERLRIFNWGYYLSPAVIERFEVKHGVTVAYEEFGSMDEATLAVRRGTPYDLFFPTIDFIGKLAVTGLLQPLNHDYLPNYDRYVWPSLRHPFYDPGAAYSVPYSVWTNGIIWRTDRVKEDISAMENPYEFFWTAPYAGRMAILDEYRDALALAMNRRGLADVNTTEPSVFAQARDDLIELVTEQDVALETLLSDSLPDASYLVQQSRSGAAVMTSRVAQDPSLFGYLWPPMTDPGTVPGVVGNDMMTIPASARSPVLAHMFIDQLFDPETAAANLRYTGYQPPNLGLNPDELVARGTVAPNMRSALISPEELQYGSYLLELDPATDQRWHRAYGRVRAAAW